MNNITEFQNMWQSQQEVVPERFSDVEKTITILDKLAKTGKKHLRINILKTSLVLFFLSQMIYFLDKMVETGPFTLAGMLVIILSLTGFMFLYWKKQLNFKASDFINPGPEMIRIAITKLSGHKKLFTRWFPVLIPFMIAGINLIYFEILSQSDFTFRITIHALVSGFIALAAGVGLRVRFWRIKRENDPLINDLLKLKKEMSDEK